MSHDPCFDEPDERDLVPVTHLASPPAATPTGSALVGDIASASPRRRRRGEAGTVAAVTLRKPRRGRLPPEPVPSPQAKRTAAVVLEVLAGLRSTGEAARALGVTPVRFYSISSRGTLDLSAFVVT